MNRKKIVANLNRLLAYEYGALLQYQQYGFLVRGLWRQVYQSFFEQASDESRVHARLLGHKIVALGGIPVVEPTPIQQSNRLEEMLHQALELERSALEVLLDTLELAHEDVALRTLLEDQALEEATHVEELEKLLDDVQKSARLGVDRLAS